MEQLGIDGKLLFAQIVNFLIIGAVLTKFLYRPVLRFIKKRQEEIDEGLALSEKMEKELKAFEIEKKVALKKAQKEADTVLEDAKKAATAQKKEMIAQARTEIETMQRAFEKRMDAETQKVQKVVEKSAVVLAEKMVNQLLVDVLSEREQHKLIQKQLAQLERSLQK